MKEKILALVCAMALGASLALAAGCGASPASSTASSSSAGSSASSSANTSSTSSSASAAASSSSAAAQAAEVTDYSKASSWYKLPEIAKDVDTFFIYPTQYMGFGESDSDYAPLDDANMLAGLEGVYAKQASAFEGSTNLFMPLYQQASMRIEAAARQETGDIESVLSTTPLADITAALDYYFENYNNGRPFIIAGHSQGSAMTRLVLKTYFKEHPDRYSRMVAAYAIGYSITRDDLDANPHMRFATGEEDAGVIVSWNTEGRENVDTNADNIAVLTGGISINPLNWKLDGTYAPAGENKGSLVPTGTAGGFEIADIGADAQVDVGRGVVVTNANSDPIAMSEYFGPQSFHNGDYSFFYNNIRENVAKRIATYQETH